MIVVGGVSQLFQGDLDLGRRVAERLAAEDLGPDVVVEDLHYGAIAVTQRLEELQPDALILVGAEGRGRPPGTVERRRIADVAFEPAEVQEAMADAGTGWVAIDLIIPVAAGLGALPQRTVTIEVEPSSTRPSDQLSPAATAALEEAVALVRTEVPRVRLLWLADEIRQQLGDGHVDENPALGALQALLAELDILDRDGRWGATFRERDRLRLRIAAGDTGEGMRHEDWALWWTLIEELDRLERVEATG